MRFPTQIFYFSDTPRKIEPRVSVQVRKSSLFGRKYVKIYCIVKKLSQIEDIYMHKGVAISKEGTR